MRKGSAPTLRAGLLNSASNFRETLKQYLENYQALAFMNSLDKCYHDTMISAPY